MMEPGQITREELAAFQQSLRRWYRSHGRNLPWRDQRDAYRVWISEIMLQQTTVAAVKPYYERFLARFPDVHTLAAASEEEVLRLWEGLGYYSRGRNLHRAAQAIVAEYDGTLPSSPSELRQLPGIGRYTAGAIASFAYDQRQPIVEANTLRLYCRLMGDDGDPRSSEGQRRLWEFAEQILPKRSPGEFNQALMDLGATICTPSNPNCEACPVHKHCEAFRSGRQHEIPRPAKRVQLTDVLEATVVVSDRGKYLVRRYPPGERWAGLWDFVRFPVPDTAIVLSSKPSSSKGTKAPAKTSAIVSPSLLTERVMEMTGIIAAPERLLMELNHGVTRYRIRLLCWTAARTGGKLHRDRELQWVSSDEFAELPFSTTGRRIASRVAAGDES